VETFELDENDARINLGPLADLARPVVATIRLRHVNVP
jgi:hypothetical protein